MTECERIVEQCILPPEFFYEDERCGFTVSIERKKIWAIGLDLFFQLQKVCEKYKLKYFLFWGSLLGVIRHKGFIPWDDDLDIGMPREDYEELISHAKDFSFPYFLHNHSTDNTFYYSHTKLRNSNTSAINRAFKHQSFNHGMSIDIHPIDNWDIVNGKKDYEIINTLNINNSTYMRINNPDLTEAEIERVKNYNSNPEKDIQEIQRIAKKYIKESTDFVSCPTLTLYEYGKNCFNKTDFEKIILGKFEGFDVPIPCGWKNILNTIYGNWKEYPPVKDRGHLHDRNLVDPDTPYSEKLRK